jgi:TRAP-type C4-dicarboxylate transport system permease small subunit
LTLIEGLVMPGLNAAMGTLTVPIWLAGAVAAVLVFAVLLAARRAGGVALITSLFRVALVALLAYAGWVYLQRVSSQDEVAVRRSLDERSAALMARAIAPGSALACLDELAGETVEVACEKGVFASPEAVAAAVSYTTAKLALLADGTQHARQDAAFAADLVPLRVALELDRFGIVAHVLERRDGCTPERCDALARFTDPSHVRDNLRDHMFDDHVSKYTAMWNSPARAEASVATATAPLPTTLTPAPAAVSPRYDFPSAQSIPAVNIMAPEPAARPQAAAPAAPANAGEGGGTAAATPVPPRRPPQNRVAAPARPAVARPDAQPPAAGDPPTDGAVPRTAPRQ